MKQFTIITDSCCSLNADEAKELGIVVLPLAFMIGGKTYLDTPEHAELSAEAFFKKLQAGQECTTAAVNIDQYINAMRTELDAGNDVLCVCFSSALSCTYQNAFIAANEMREEFPDSKIIVIDSLCACRGMGMLIYRTVMEQREKQLDIEQTAGFVLRERNHQGHWFFVDDLHHLHRGGRVSKLVAVAGSVLNIKPVMHCDAEGKLTAVGKAHGVNGAIKALIEKMKEHCVSQNKEQTVFICHANCPEYVQKISQLLKDEFGITDIRADYICPVIGAHTGCGTLGLFFAGKSR